MLYIVTGSSEWHYFVQGGKRIMRVDPQSIQSDALV